MRTKLLALLAASVLLLPMQQIHAQQPTLQLLVDGPTIIGIATQVDGSPAADMPLQLQEITRPTSAAITLTTDAAGVFLYTGKALTQYSASAMINGQSVSATASTGEGPDVPLQWPPIYVTLGLLMLLSLIPAHFLKRKDA